ncbi:MAG TPA: hypothetical protein VGI81_17210 [Tepidisphaeraceae bacterium]|jgi:hypothetical protein
MGQAAVDLPDPLNPPPPADAAVNTDDLLAQMAGEEIDRLLAEQDPERPAKPAPPPPPSKSAPNPSAQSGPSVASDKTKKSSEADGLSGVLGGLAPAADAGPDPVARLATPPPASSNGKSTAELLDEELAADEARSALSSAKFKEKPDAAAAASSSPAPLPLRVLAWISAPLDACPDHVREAIGKVAIITAVNAVAVLVYVLFFRPHHG